MRSLRYLTLLVGAVTLGGVACAPESTTITPGQIVLYVDTDAPVPAGPNQHPGLATPLFDRLRVEVFRPGESAPCDACTNEFEINGSLLSEHKASFGIVPLLHVGGYRARVRIFRAAFASRAGDPNPAATLEVTVALPVVDDDAIVEATATLLTDDVGNPQGSLAAPKDPIVGPPSESRVGTWRGAARTSCTGGPPDGAVCVPGGAYWMGNPNAPGFTPQLYVPEPRLVVLSPFFAKSTEVTVREFRALGRTPKMIWTGSSSGSRAPDWCTFAATSGPFEALPMNCVTVDEARGYCVAQGGDLPTEAQFEYVAGGLVGNDFPWGRDEPTCADAIYGRGGWGILAALTSPCKMPTPPGAPALPGTGARDRFDLPGGTIVDLAGNMTEWTQDVWNRIDEPCWERRTVYRDPHCTTESPHDGPLAVHRGGNWAEVSNFMVASARYSHDTNFANVQTGFRCVWPSR